MVICYAVREQTHYCFSLLFPFCECW